MYRHITIALLCMLAPLACTAEDFDYDEDATVEITDDEWDDGHHDVTVEIEDITTGISNPSAGEPQQDAAVRIADRHILITTSTPMTIPLYRLDLPAAEFISIPAGSTSIELPQGIYIIAGHKYLI